MNERQSLLEALLREFEELPVRRVTGTTVVMERGPLDTWRAKCGEAIRHIQPRMVPDGRGGSRPARGMHDHGSMPL